MSPTSSETAHKTLSTSYIRHNLAGSLTSYTFRSRKTARTRVQRIFRPSPTLSIPAHFSTLGNVHYQQRKARGDAPTNRRHGTNTGRKRRCPISDSDQPDYYKSYTRFFLPCSQLHLESADVLTCFSTFFFLLRRFFLRLCVWGEGWGQIRAPSIFSQRIPASSFFFTNK